MMIKGQGHNESSVKLCKSVGELMPNDVETRSELLS